jgi:atypical dual specificity phosphatase
VYNVSLTYNKFLSLPNATFSQGGRPWWTPLVLPYGTIVLGALPLQPEGHLETLTEATVAANGFSRVRAVLTLNKAYELQPTYLNTPVSTEGWVSKGVDQMIFPVEDFNRPTPEQFDEACVFLDKHMAQQNTVYVHCKAGRGRSCAVVCCYLVHRGMTADEAMAFVKQRRPHVSLGESQQAAVKAFEAHHLSAGAASVPAIAERAAGGAMSATLANEEDEPTAVALKQKPKFTAYWPQRFIAIRDQKLLVFDTKEMFDAWTQDETGAPETRTTSIEDLSNCIIEGGMEKFTLLGEHFKMTVSTQNEAGFNTRKDKEANFAFQAEYDRDRFLHACRNISEGQKWNASRPAEADGDGAVPEPELAAEPEAVDQGIEQAREQKTA